jgi:hypothetical protein
MFNGFEVTLRFQIYLCFYIFPHMIIFKYTVTTQHRRIIMSYEKDGVVKQINITKSEGGQMDT